MMMMRKFLSIDQAHAMWIVKPLERAPKVLLLIWPKCNVNWRTLQKESNKSPLSRLLGPQRMMPLIANSMI